MLTVLEEDVTSVHFKSNSIDDAIDVRGNSGQGIVLLDDGNSGDQQAGDGIIHRL